MLSSTIFLFAKSSTILLVPVISSVTYFNIVAFIPFDFITIFGLSSSRFKYPVISPFFNSSFAVASSTYFKENNLSLFSSSLKASKDCFNISLFLVSLLSTIAILIILNFSLFSIFENARLKNVAIIIGNAKVQNISILLPNSVFKVYLKLCININL